MTNPPRVLKDPLSLKLARNVDTHVGADSSSKAPKTGKVFPSHQQRAIQDARQIITAGEDLINSVNTKAGLEEVPVDKFVQLAAKLDHKTADDFAMKLVFVTTAPWSDGSQSLTQVGSEALKTMLVLKPTAETAVEVLGSYRANKACRPQIAPKLKTDTASVTPTQKMINTIALLNIGRLHGLL